MTPYRDRLEAGFYEPGASAEPDLDSMTKAQLLAHAQAAGLDVTEAMTKAEIRDAIDGAA